MPILIYDRYISGLQKSQTSTGDGIQNCFINTRLSITVRQDCAWQHPHSNPERTVGTEEPPCGFCFNCGKARHQPNTCPCFSCRQYAALTVDKQDTEEVDWGALPRQAGGSPSIFLLHKTVSHILGEKPEDGCPSTAGEPWATVQAASHLCHSHSCGSCLLCTSCFLREHSSFSGH